MFSPTRTRMVTGCLLEMSHVNMWTWYKIQCKSVKIFRGEYRKETFSTLLSHFWVSTLSRETNRLRDASLSISPKSMRTLFVCLLLMIRHSKSAGIVLLLDRGSG